MLERYGHGGDLLTASAEYGAPPDDFLDFSSNMNPFGPPDCVGAILRDRWRELSRYPDPAVRELRDKLARTYGVPPESILVGNGAAELIDLAVRSLRPAVTALARPSFSEYEEAIGKTGGRLREIPLSAAEGFAVHGDALRRAAAGCDLLLLGHPNNPTGRLLDAGAIRALAEDGVRLVLDEAFMDFVQDEAAHSLIRLAAERGNVIVLRSMTKFYAVPGIRLGFVVAHPSQIERMRRLQVPWSVNALAQWIGTAVLDDAAYAERTRRWLAAERPWLSAQLESLGLTVFPSDANFLLLRLPKGLPAGAKTAQRMMGLRGVLIRDASLFPGLDESYVRVAVKLRHENEQLVRCLREVLDLLKAGKTDGD